MCSILRQLMSLTVRQVTSKIIFFLKVCDTTVKFMKFTLHQKSDKYAKSRAETRQKQVMRVRMTRWRNALSGFSKTKDLKKGKDKIKSKSNKINNESTGIWDGLEHFLLQDVELRQGADRHDGAGNSHHARQLLLPAVGRQMGTRIQRESAQISRIVDDRVGKVRVLGEWVWCPGGVRFMLLSTKKEKLRRLHQILSNIREPDEWSFSSQPSSSRRSIQSKLGRFLLDLVAAV